MRVCALAGGVGGAKLAAGLQAVLPPGDLSIVTNTADDFDLWGLRVCPDLDTVMYTLAGIANEETGWGVAGESFNVLAMISAYGQDAWFRLGDRDLATHVLRTQRLRAGARLTEVTAGLAAALGLKSTLLPMCDEPVATVLETPEGLLEFQEYFVRRGQRDEVLDVKLRGIENARVPAETSEAISRAEAIIFCPSNPVVSIGPILAVPGMRELLANSPVPKVAVSPIVGGRALKGPADKMLRSLGHEVSAVGVARMYEGMVDGFVVDRLDGEEETRISTLGMRVRVADAVMRDGPDRERLAREVVSLCSEMGAG
ncbi:MAG: Lactyl (2) diphospho-(5')guanosine:7,8-didemethyl-8-hydroxy-5-deazariboflavin 2-phospho-L-lactate transferase [uncultured Rubrobacteraceae bacterium]|uniref:Lactyl (2) diphospho-(5')guanosine:7,8-didemethyl-8-hydroxy-5-deazarib oflavin 2-phospho-L-lactate transferase n=1 Tax=uncultured Rubrobacteraceae bacterium TaxID=349277 RepID=A0A6J4QI54_9ACTN|nr:MAG: Lactyl (2) diphospho-(5')guanosine:7,8-didemethyl-8-hydroxy-5-deazariboflavin 2-phospho-L-lactate transferase [uncultured Rubrobacteraceae bacterium]